MGKNTTITYLLNPKNWWLPLLLIFVISIAGVTMIGVQTYTEAPPIPNYISTGNKTIFSSEDVLDGQAVFQKYALMEYGSMFGDGANRGPDYTAEALHYVAVYMNDYYRANLRSAENADLLVKGVAEKVKAEIKNNSFTEKGNKVILTEAQAFAANELVRYYQEKFTNTNAPGAFKPAGYITDARELRSLTAFFFWGAWVCGVDRPGEQYSYTHNWPFDPEAGNTPSSAIILWSIIGALGLILGLGIVLYYHGKLDKLDDDAYTHHAQPFMTHGEIRKFQPDAVQKSTYKYFYVAILLFGI